MRVKVVFILNFLQLLYTYQLPVVLWVVDLVVVELELVLYLILAVVIDAECTCKETMTSNARLAKCRRTGPLLRGDHTLASENSSVTDNIILYGSVISRGNHFLITAHFFCFIDTHPSINQTSEAEPDLVEAWKINEMFWFFFTLFQRMTRRASLKKCLPGFPVALKRQQT